jgi:hypothetical protein
VFGLIDNAYDAEASELGQLGDDDGGG